MMTDPIADMLTRIRNAMMARHASVTIPASRIKVEIARILKDEGYIKNYKVMRDDHQGSVKLQLKYGPDGKSVIHGLERVSRPGLRTYSRAKDVKTVFGGIGISILTTSHGLMTGQQGRERNIGGEILCRVW